MSLLRRRYALNVIGGLLAFAVTAGLSIVATPYLVRALGDASYGLWALAFTVVQLTVFLDFGFMSASLSQSAPEESSTLAE